MTVSKMTSLYSNDTQPHTPPGTTDRDVLTTGAHRGCGAEPTVAVNTRLRSLGLFVYLRRVYVSCWLAGVVFKSVSFTEFYGVVIQMIAPTTIREGMINKCVVVQCVENH